MKAAYALTSLEVASLLFEALQLVGRHLGSKAGDSLLFLLDLFPLLCDLPLALDEKKKSAERR